jgi:hypothetical protein
LVETAEVVEIMVTTVLSATDFIEAGNKVAILCAESATTTTIEIKTPKTTHCLPTAPRSKKFRSRKKIESQCNVLTAKELVNSRWSL